MSTRLRNTVNQIRERINLRIYDSKPFVTKFLRYLSVPLSLTAVAALIFSFGYQLNTDRTFWPSTFFTSNSPRVTGSGPA